MKKFLPRTSSNKQGFTLVELLVVVSIIAILSVIGVATFTSVQKNARDARRKADIDAMASAFEAAYSPSAGYSVTGTPLTGANFSSGSIPVDPLNAGTSATPATSYIYYSSGFSAAGSAYDPAGNRLFSSSNTNFLVCAHMESGTGGNSTVHSALTAPASQNTGGWYCRANQQ